MLMILLSLLGLSHPVICYSESDRGVSRIFMVDKGITRSIAVGEPWQFLSVGDPSQAGLFYDETGKLRILDAIKGELIGAIDLAPCLRKAGYGFRAGVWICRYKGERWLAYIKTSGDVFNLDPVRGTARRVFNAYEAAKRIGIAKKSGLALSTPLRVTLSPSGNLIAFGTGTSRDDYITGEAFVDTICYDLRLGTSRRIGPGSPIGFTSESTVIVWEEGLYGKTKLRAYTSNGRLLRVVDNVRVAAVSGSSVFLTTQQREPLHDPYIERWTGDLHKRLDRFQVRGTWASLLSTNFFVCEAK